MIHTERVQDFSKKDRFKFELALVEGLKAGEAWQFMRHVLTEEMKSRHRHIMDGNEMNQMTLVRLTSEMRAMEWVMNFVQNFSDEQREIDRIEKQHKKEMKRMQAAQVDTDTPMLSEWTPTIE